MAPFPRLPMLAILTSVVSYVVVQMNMFPYAGCMVQHLGVVEDKEKAGENGIFTVSGKVWFTRPPSHPRHYYS